MFINRIIWGQRMFVCLLILFHRLKEYGLDDSEDEVANYMILSLMSDQMSPALHVRLN